MNNFQAAELNAVNPRTKVSFLDTCDCCGETFSSTELADVAICKSCDDTASVMMNKIVDDAIEGAIAKMREVGGYDDNIAKLQALNSKQRCAVVESWYNN